jgi:hypothetical protein
MKYKAYISHENKEMEEESYVSKYSVYKLMRLLLLLLSSGALLIQCKSAGWLQLFRFILDVIANGK